MIHKKITQLREANGLNQAQLAELLECTRAAVSVWEKGISSPNMRMLIRLADLFQIPLDELVGRDQQRSA